jgi:hypothetical protein
MRMKWMWLVGVAGGILVCALLAQPQAVPLSASPEAASAVREIQISSTRVNHGGAMRRSPAQPGAEPDKTFLEISRNGDGYHLGDAVIDANLVGALANALRAPVNPEPTREDLGFTPAWLKANASSLGQSFAASTFIGGKPIHQSAFELAFADPAAVDKAILLLFQPRRCVDCDRFTQSVEISIEFDDGTRVAARTSSEFPYMLPWHMQSDGKDTVAYNADISRAIAGLMPEKSANRSRLAGERLATQLGHILLTQEEHEVRLQEVESQTGGTLSGLRSRYSVESASIGNYGDPVLRKPEDENAADEQTLDLHLQASSDLSHNFFSDEVFLRYVNGKVVDADKFLENAPRYEKLVLSVPWLSRFVQDQSRKVLMRLSFLGGSSFSDAEMKVFAADMHAIGRDQLIPKVEAAKNQIAALIVGYGAEESDWLVFPDGHMLLWRYWQTPVYGKPSLLKWSSSPPDKKPCAKLGNNFVGCVGMEISAEGNVEPFQSARKD